MRYEYYQPIEQASFARAADPRRFQYVLVWLEDLPELPTKGNEVGALEMIWARHNRDDRPRGREIRSMCTGDVVKIRGNFWLVNPIGWRYVPPAEITIVPGKTLVRGEVIDEEPNLSGPGTYGLGSPPDTGET